MTSSPIPPVSSTDPDVVWFPVRVTSVPTVGQYLFQEVWTLPGGIVADKLGGRFNSATDPAYAIDGSTFAVTAAGSPVQVLCRRSPGSAGVGWDLVSSGGSGPDASKTQRGWVSTGTQSFAGVKTFYSGVRIGDGTPGAVGTISFDPAGDAGLSSISGSTGLIQVTTGVGGGAAVGILNLTGGAGVNYAISDGTGFYQGLHASFLTGDGRTATFKGGILIGLV